jgi:hypothetical protein
VIADKVKPAECSADRVPETSAPYLRGLAVGDNGNVYIAATGCRVVVRIDRRGTVTTVLRAESPWAPTAVALHGHAVYVLERGRARNLLYLKCAWAAPIPPPRWPALPNIIPSLSRQKAKGSMRDARRAGNQSAKMILRQSASAPPVNATGSRAVIPKRSVDRILLAQVPAASQQPHLITEEFGS